MRFVNSAAAEVPFVGEEVVDAVGIDVRKDDVEDAEERDAEEV